MARVGQVRLVGVATGKVWSVGVAHCVGEWLLRRGVPALVPLQVTQCPAHLRAQRLQRLQPSLGGHRRVGGGHLVTPGDTWDPQPRPGVRGGRTCSAHSLLGPALAPSIPRSFRRRNLRK